MPKHNRNEFYEAVLVDFAPVKSPTEAKPNKFALVCCDDEADTAWITTHKTLNEVLKQIEQDESDFAPNIVIDLDTGKQHEPVVAWELEGIEEDYFDGEAASEEEAEGEEAEGEEVAP